MEKRGGSGPDFPVQNRKRADLAPTGDPACGAAEQGGGPGSLRREYLDKVQMQGLHQVTLARVLYSGRSQRAFCMMSARTSTAFATVSYTHLGRPVTTGTGITAGFGMMIGGVPTAAAGLAAGAFFFAGFGGSFRPLGLSLIHI